MKALCFLLKNLKFSLKYILLLILEREEGRERETETLIWETSICCFLYTSWPGIKPATQVCALTGNRTCSLLVYVRWCSNYLSHMAKGSEVTLNGRTLLRNTPVKTKQHSSKFLKWSVVCVTRCFVFLKMPFTSWNVVYEVPETMYCRRYNLIMDQNLSS